MSTINYTSLHEIRREAGLVRQTTDTRVAGEVDGANRSFYTNQTPIIDRNNDDVVTTADVSAFVDDVPAIVQAVDAETGAVVLVTPPEVGKEVALAYEFSAASDSEVAKRRSNAINWLHRREKAYYNLAAIDSANFPDAWEDAVRLRAAGFLQISDWGTNIDTDGTSKDGYEKIKLAGRIIDEWIADQNGTDPDDPNAVGASNASFASDGDFVGRRKGGGFPGCDPERMFHNKRC